MSNIVLALGPIEFSSFEIPVSIGFGGRQILAVHQLTDGRRVIDSVGPADLGLAFSGAFSGPTATFRARLLNTLRATGAQLSLTWDVFCYTVVIDRFEADYRNPIWIPYHLSCAVLQDDASPAHDSIPSLDVSVSSDLTTAAAECAGIGIDFTGALATLTDARATTLGSAAYGAALTAIGNALSAIAAQMALAEATIESLVTRTETCTSSLTGDLLHSTGVAQQLAGMTFGYSYVGRAARNLQNASS